MNLLELNLKIYYSFNFFSGIFGIQKLVQKYTVSVAHSLRENGITRWKRETARSRGMEEQDWTVSLKHCPMGSIWVAIANQDNDEDILHYYPLAKMQKLGGDHVSLWIIPPCLTWEEEATLKGRATLSLLD